MTIAEQLGLSPVKPYTHNKAVPLPAADPALLMGLELEIEGIPEEPTELYVGGMYGDADNSLRSNQYGRGWEFITKPATFSVAAFILSNFFGKAKLTQERNYSERCSIHVHANVQDLETDQLKTISILYQVFERLFYSYAGNDRDKNIFCVPWSETMLTYQLIDKLSDGGIKGLRHWQKYTGLNLLPITTQGTIEFRHLPGTCDLQRILDWMNLIGCLFATARKTSFDEIKDVIIKVNNNSEYKNILHIVFGNWSHVLDIPHMEEQLEEGVLDVKYMLLSSSGVKEQKTQSQFFADLANRVQIVDDWLPREAEQQAIAAVPGGLAAGAGVAQAAAPVRPGEIRFENNWWLDHGGVPGVGMGDALAAAAQQVNPFRANNNVALGDRIRQQQEIAARAPIRPAPRDPGRRR